MFSITLFFVGKLGWHAKVEMDGNYVGVIGPSNYKDAFFWKKYEKQLDADFVGSWMNTEVFQTS